MTAELKRSIDGDIVGWQYEQLYMLAVPGELEMSLSDVGDLFDTNSWEVAPVSSSPTHMLDDLTSFYFKPPVELSVIKFHHSNDSFALSGVLPKNS